MVSFVDRPASLINSDWHFLYIITYCNLCKLYTVQLVLVMAMLAKWGDKSNTFAMYVIYVRVKKLLLFRGTTGNALKILFKKDCSLTIIHQLLMKILVGKVWNAVFSWI